MNKEQAEAFAVPFPESVIRVKGGAFQADTSTTHTSPSG